MLRYLAPVTFGVCAAGVCIINGRRARRTINSVPSSSSTPVAVPARTSSSSVVVVAQVAHCTAGGASNSIGARRTNCEEVLRTRGAAMDYNQEADRMAQRVLELYSDTDWKVAKTSDIPIEATQKDIRVLFKKSTEFDGFVYRAECTLAASPERIIENILPSPKGLRGKWDKNVKESEVIEYINKDLIIARSATHSAAMGLISSRDFLDLIYIKRYPTNGMVSTHSKSIKRKDCPPREGFVRGTNYHGGTFCVPVPGETNRTRVVNIVQSDLGGMLPKTLVDSALPSNLTDFFIDLSNVLKSTID